MPHSNLHTVLGASGAVGRAVVDELLDRGLPVRAISRSMHKTGIATVPADLLQVEDAHQAIRGSSHVYLCVGLPYFAAVWKRDWPMLMRNVIKACTANHARLIFLNNAYMYGPAPLEQPFDESHPQQPVSEKGKARMLPFWLQRLIGLFIPPLREVWEMNYQFRYPYVMSDRKFRERFPEFEVTGYEEGLERMVQGFGTPKTLHRSIAGQEAKGL